jgi:hypothetical protein
MTALARGARMQFAPGAVATRFRQAGQVAGMATHAAPSPPAAALQRLHPSGKPVGIRFVGRRNGAPAASMAVASAAPPQPSAPPSKARPAAAPMRLAPLWAAEDARTAAMYPRLRVSDAEMRAVDSGGAE